MKVLEVVQVGAYGSIQDAGRIGFRSFAIPQSGCLDPHLQRLANFLTTNEPDAPVLELIGGKFVFRCLAPMCIGVVGISQTILLNGEKISPLNTIRLKTNDELAVITQLTCLSVAGILESNQHFESYSSYPLAGLGGGLLQRGNIVEALPRDIESRSIKRELQSIITDPSIIRVIRGPEWKVEMEATHFEKMQWGVSKNSNRIGIRLSGPKLEMQQGEMQSVPTFVGTIQVPPDGQPIVLMNDAQTTGGYPRIAQVIKADLPRIARLMTGGTIRFRFVTIEEARYIFHHQQAFIKHELKQSL